MEGLFGDVDSAVDDAIATDEEERAADPDRSPAPIPTRRRARATALESASRAVAEQATTVARKARRAKPWVPAIGGGVVVGGLVAAALWGHRRLEHGKPEKGEKVIEVNTSTIVPVVGVGVAAAALIYLGLKARDYVDGADSPADSESTGGGNLFANKTSEATGAAPSSSTSSDSALEELDRELAGLLGT